MGRIIIDDCLRALSGLERGSVHCVVTSPPYWRQRDYALPPSAWPEIPYRPMTDLPLATFPAALGRLGDEDDVNEWAARLVHVCRLVRPLLAPRATVWLNLGDKYLGAPGGQEGPQAAVASRSVAKAGARVQPREVTSPGLARKQLSLAPARAALALQADGWFVRSWVVWVKPSAMPESAPDRPTVAHDAVLLLSACPSYHFDIGAVREAVTGSARPRGAGVHAKAEVGAEGGRQNASYAAAVRHTTEHRRVRNVWVFPPGRSHEDHYSTFPVALPERCIALGCPPGGTVLDPFAGTGTTAVAAQRLERGWIMVEAQQEMDAVIRARTGQLALGLG